MLYRLLIILLLIAPIHLEINAQGVRSHIRSGNRDMRGGAEGAASKAELKYRKAMASDDKNAQAGNKTPIKIENNKVPLAEAPTEEGANPFHLEKRIFTGLAWRLMGRLGSQPLDISALGTAASELEEGKDYFVRIRPENVVYYNM